MATSIRRSAAEAPASTNDGAGVPLELVRYSSVTGKFEVGEKAAAALRKVREARAPILAASFEVADTVSRYTCQQAIHG